MDIQVVIEEKDETNDLVAKLSFIWFLNDMRNKLQKWLPAEASLTLPQDSNSLPPSTVVWFAGNFIESD